jgi:signal transduction histidine kinase
MMSIPIDFLVSVLTEAFRIIVSLRYISAFLEKKKRKINFVLYIVIYIMTVLIYLLFHNVLMNFTVTFLGDFLLTLSFDGKIKKRFFVTLSLLAVECSLDILATSMVSERPISEESVLIISFLSLFLFLFLTLVLEKFVKKRKENLLSAYWWFLILLLAFSSGVMVVLAQDQVVTRISALGISGVLLSTNLVVVYLYDQLIDSYTKEIENHQLRMQMNVYENQIQAYLSGENHVKALSHDMKHHMKEIHDLAQCGKNDRIITYIEQMSEFAGLKKESINTGVSAIDGILNYMLHIAEEKNIKVHTAIAIPQTLQLSAFDMNVILGNLMENAIEASDEIENPFIDISVKYDRGCLFFKIENTCNKFPVISEDGNVSSSKEDTWLHGYGIKNVSDIVNNYHGTICLEKKENYFVAKVMLILNR